MSQAQKPRYKVERVFMSDRGLHFCFKTSQEAEIAYQGGLALGRTNLSLEGSQMIATRSQPVEPTTER
ncbi:MAG: hypothetical protein AAFQ63_23910 [Cyanobacteria bacterium J06621_11]